MGTIGKRIRSIRKNAHMTQAKFSLEVGIVTGYLSQIETGAGNPGSALLKLIAARFQVCEEWLNTGNGPQYITEVDTSIDKAEATPESTLPLNNQQIEGTERLHQMLDEILDSGEQGTIMAVKSNLKESHEKIIEKRKAEIEKKESKFRQVKSDKKIEELEREIGNLKKAFVSLGGQSNPKETKKEQENKPLSTK